MPDFIHRFVPGTLPLTLLLLHGTGGTEDDLLGLGQQLLPGAALLSPRGQVSENGMPRFFRRFAEGVFDEEDIIRRSNDLADFVADAAKQYGFDPQRVIAVGYSNGANIAASLMLLRPEVLVGGVLLRAMVPLRPEKLPALEKKHVFLAGGRQDSMIPPAQVEALAMLLREAGADVEEYWSPGGHGLAQGDFDAAAAWLAERF